MLILENLTFTVAKRSFLNSTRKMIKISLQPQIVVTKQPGVVKSPTLIEWKEPVALPLQLNTRYRFEIYEEHSFGYNPEELNGIACGQFTISDNDTYNSWEVVSDRGNKLGFLSAKIRRKLRYAPNVSVAQPEEQVMTVSSVMAHLVSLKQKRGYVILTVHGKTFKTEISKSKAGELLFTESMQIQKTDEMLEAKIDVYQYDAKEEKSVLAGTGTLNLDPEKHERKAVVRNDKGVEVGDVFVDYKVVSKDVFAMSKQLTKIVLKNALLNNSSIESNHNYPSTSRTLSLSQHYGSDLVNRRPKKQRVSVVNHNHNVFIPSQKRFSNYSDKQNNNISYLRQRDPFDFKDEQAKLYYKGASIGVGDKFDFTNVFKSNPGVGAYKLPSIWDRY